jgi:hypothetical protein
LSVFTGSYVPTTSSPSGSITIPAGASAGDVGLLWLSINSGSATLTTAPSGWTIVGSLIANSTSHRAVLYQRTVTSSGTGSPGSTVSWTWSATGHISAGIVTSDSPTGAIDTSTTWNDNTADTTLAPSSITPGVANAVIFYLISTRAAAGPVTLTSSFPGTATEILDDFANWSSGVVPGVHAATKTVATGAGVAVTSGTGTYSTAVTKVGWAISVPPPAASIPRSVTATRVAVNRASLF